MTSKPKAQLAPLPWSEILGYWVLSLGSHLYSFYQLHKFSKGKVDGQISVCWSHEVRRKCKKKYEAVITCSLPQNMKQDYRENSSWKTAFLRVLKGWVQFSFFFQSVSIGWYKQIRDTSSTFKQFKASAHQALCAFWMPMVKFVVCVRTRQTLNGISGLSGPRSLCCGLWLVMAWYRDWPASFIPR